MSARVGSTTLDPQKQSKLARSALQQVISEPFEIAKQATEQLSGMSSKEISHAPDANNSELSTPIDPEQQKIKDIKRLQAARRDLDQEVYNQYIQRQQEISQLRREEEEKKVAEEKTKQEEQPLIEMESKKPKGVMLGMAGAIKKKTNRVELNKTPSN